MRKCSLPYLLHMSTSKITINVSTFVNFGKQPCKMTYNCKKLDNNLTCHYPRLKIFKMTL